MPVMEPEVYAARLRQLLLELRGCQMTELTLHRAVHLMLQEWVRWAALGLVDSPHGPALAAFTMDGNLDLALGPDEVAEMEERMSIHPARYLTYPRPFRVGPPTKLAAFGEAP